MRCNRLLQRSTFGTTEKELIKGSNLRHFDGSFRAERVLIRHRLKWTRHFAHATGTVSVRVRRTGGVSKVLFEKVFRGNKSSPLRCSNREKAGVIRRRWIHSYGFCSKIRLGRAVRKRFVFSRTVFSQLLCGFQNFRFTVRFLCRKSIRVNINCRSTSQDTCTA